MKLYLIDIEIGILGESVNVTYATKAKDDEEACNIADNYAREYWCERDVKEETDHIKSGSYTFQKERFSTCVLRVNEITPTEFIKRLTIQ